MIIVKTLTVGLVGGYSQGFARLDEFTKEFIAQHVDGDTIEMQDAFYPQIENMT